MAEDAYWRAKIKKLALAYETGWEYRPGSEEPGSVLTDIFMEMTQKNLERLGRVWEKQELVFLRAVPEPEETSSGGKERQLQLTPAGLRYAIYRRGLSAWLVCEAEKGAPTGPVPLFQAVGEELAHPCFGWRFPGLCDGRRTVCVQADFTGISPEAPLGGSWTVRDGKAVVPLEWEQTDSGYFLRGQTPEFAENRSGEPYEVRLELPAGEEPPEEWRMALYGGLSLTRAAEEAEAQLCLTDDCAGGGERVLPFGSAPEEAACCYLSCDSLMAEGGGLCLRFQERFLREERLPEPPPEECERLYRKYPWLRPSETVQEWKPSETLWEYFDGTLWRSLPGSEGWQTFCGTEEGERTYRWVRPADMEPCTVEGREHFYIRLRLRRVCNAYAPYYRKWIPVMEHIRFAAGERRITPSEALLPRRAAADEENMYLGFADIVTPQNCWYGGKGVYSFAREQIRGEETLFGKKAFWVEWTDREAEEFSSLEAKDIPVNQQMGEEDEEPVRLEKKAAENYFMHFGRLLTTMDLELMLQERYPFLAVSACSLRQGERCLAVELALAGKADISEEEAQERLPEIEEWLAWAVLRQGALWLAGCRVSCLLKKTGERREDRSHAAGDIAG